MSSKVSKSLSKVSKQSSVTAANALPETIKVFFSRAESILKVKREPSFLDLQNEIENTFNIHPWMQILRHDGKQIEVVDEQWNNPIPKEYLETAMKDKAETINIIRRSSLGGTAIEFIIDDKIFPGKVIDEHLESGTLTVESFIDQAQHEFSFDSPKIAPAFTFPKTISKHNFSWELILTESNLSKLGNPRVVLAPPSGFLSSDLTRFGSDSFFTMCPTKPVNNTGLKSKKGSTKKSLPVKAEAMRRKSFNK